MTEITVFVRDGDHISPVVVSDERLIAAAADIPAADPDRDATVSIDGRAVDGIQVLSAALGLLPDEFAFRRSMEALHSALGGNAAEMVSRDRQLYVEDSQPAPPRWEAIRNGKRVDTDAELASLISRNARHHTVFARLRRPEKES